MRSGTCRASERQSPIWNGRSRGWRISLLASGGAGRCEKWAARIGSVAERGGGLAEEAGAVAARGYAVDRRSR